MEELAEKADKLRDEFLALMDEDVLAFNEFMQAMRLPKIQMKIRPKEALPCRKPLKRLHLCRWRR